MRQAQRLLSLSFYLSLSLPPFPLPLSFSLCRSPFLSFSFCFSILRSAEVGKANPVLRVAQRRIMVYEGKRAGSRRESSTPILSRRSLSLITHVNTTLQPSKSRRCSLLKIYRLTVLLADVDWISKSCRTSRSLGDADSSAGINMKCIWTLALSFCFINKRKIWRILRYNKIKKISYKSQAFSNVMYIITFNN